MKLLLVVIVIFAALHCGQASEAACELADFDYKGMEKFWEMECESYMEDGQFNVPVSVQNGYNLQVVLQIFPWQTKVCKMAAYGIGNGYTTEEEWATFRDAESEEAATEAAQVILINLGQGQSGFAGEPGLSIIV